MLTLYISTSGEDKHSSQHHEERKLKVISTKSLVWLLKNRIELNVEWNVHAFVVDALQCQMLCGFGVAPSGVSVEKNLNKALENKYKEIKQKYRAAKHVVTDSWRCEAIKSSIHTLVRSRFGGHSVDYMCWWSSFTCLTRFDVRPRTRKMEKKRKLMQTRAFPWKENQNSPCN